MGKWGILGKKGANIWFMGQMPHIWSTPLKRGKLGTLLPLRFTHGFNKLS